MIGIIYMYISPSNKVYIGQTYDEKRRRSLFLSSTRSYGGRKIDNARKKYGPENFKYKILFKIETEDRDILINELNSKEEYYIMKYNSIKYGYNILSGGSVYHEFEYTKEIRSKMGKHSNKAIIQYSLSGEFIKDWVSASEAGRVLGIRPSLISKCCLRQTKHCRNFIFRFVGDIVRDDEKNPTINKTKNLKVIQTKDDIVVNIWKSVAAASRDLGIERHKLSQLLKNGSFNFNNSIISQG